MACCVMAPSHYLNQCWLIITKVQYCSCESNFTWDIIAPTPYPHPPLQFHVDMLEIANHLGPEDRMAICQTAWQKMDMIQIIMITSSNGNIFHVTGHLCGEFTGHLWIPCTKAGSHAELWWFVTLGPSAEGLLSSPASVRLSVCLSVPIILVNTITQSVYSISPPNLLCGFNIALSWMVL